MTTIKEIRVITHTPNPPEAFVAVIFGDDTTSTFDRAFPDAAAATLFADGMRAGLQWAQNLEQPLKAAAQGALDILNEVDECEMARLRGRADHVVEELRLALDVAS